MKPLDSLALSQVERRLQKLREVIAETKVKPGWIYYMRQALGLTLANLGKISHLSKASVQQIEKREAEGKITLQTLKKMADAMDCELIYAIIPRREIKEFIRQKAIEKATKLVSRADMHMTLEDQQVKAQLADRIERLADELIAKGDVW